MEEFVTNNNNKQKNEENAVKMKDTVKKVSDFEKYLEKTRAAMKMELKPKDPEVKTNPAQSQKKENSRKQHKKPAKKQEKPGDTIKIIHLGGLDEIGKNLIVIESPKDIIVIDCGLAFPDEEMLGVDIVLPDYTYLLKNKDKIRGILLTHGHEDHIGGLPYMLKDINVPIYGTKLTLGLVEGKLKEKKLLGNSKLVVISPKDIIELGCFSIEFIRVNHSIPDAVAMAIHTPAGVIIHTGDFKVDYTPISGDVIDLSKFGELGRKGVLALMSDSTNAERPGSTMSEKKVGESFELLIKKAESRRVIIATFSSNIHRIQQIIDAAVKFGRKIAVSGRSMENVFNIAVGLGYLKVQKELIIPQEMIKKYPHEKVIIITTGSQGETMSALTRMAASEHRNVEVGPNDFIIISATPIPGNEKLVSKVINQLMKSGCEVVYESMYDVHVSGHACQDELKLILSLTNPEYFIPVHGETKHLMKHAALATTIGIPKEKIIVSGIGKVIELAKDYMNLNDSVPAGKILVDGLGVGDVGSVVLKDRKHLSEDGLIIVVMTYDTTERLLLAGPEIVSRGFVYVKESNDFLQNTRRFARNLFEESLLDNNMNLTTVKSKLKDEIGRFIYQRTKRNPMVLPIIMEV